jgi:hypothetical protein
MQYLNILYTIYYNVKRKRNGHLFQGRYKSLIVDSDAYYARVSRYVHLNPVRAKMVAAPDQYLWSSNNDLVSARGSKCLDIDRIRKFLAMDIKAYKRFVEESDDDSADLFKDVYAGFIC